MRCFLMLIILFINHNAYAQEVADIKSVNFIQDGEVSKLIIDIDGEFIANRVHIKADKQILLDLKNVRAENRFLRGIDTSEFSGSSVYISPYKKPGSKNEIRFAIQLRDNIRSFIEKKSQRIILHIENRFGVFTRAKLKQADQGEVVADGKDLQKQKVLIPKSNSLDDILENLTQSGVKRYVGRKISLNVNNVSYPDVLKIIGDTSGFNIIIEDEVNGLKPLSINLTNLPWDQVLDTVMDLGKLVAVRYGNILTIKTEQKAREERQKELDEQTQTKTLEPLVTKIFPISFAKEEDLTKILESYITKDRGSLNYDARTQNMIVRDTVEAIEKIRKIIETLDTQTPQVLIEAKIVEASENYELRAGLSTPGLTFSYDPFSGNREGIGLGTNGGAFTFNSATSPNQSSPISAAIQVGKLTSLGFELDLMETESKGRVVSSPKVITQNGEEAKIFDSTQRSFVQTVVQNGTATQTIVPLQTQIGLTVTPNVTNDGSIAMKLEIFKGGFNPPSSPGELPQTTNKNVETNVLVDNGSTVSVGGIYVTQKEEVQSGIPFLKDLPVIGWLFKSGYNPSNARAELLIFITPRIINQEEAGLVNRQLGEDIGL